jgi:hypothetical protein
MKSPPESEDDSVHRTQDVARIQAALWQGVQEALRQHKRAGNPVAVWRDGRVVWLPPDEIPVDDGSGGCTERGAD